MAPLAAPEPMNATTSHSKLRVATTLPKESVVAGRFVTGRMEVECKSDKLGIGVIMVELFAFQELTSRDHSARMTFLHSRRLFQGPNLPPSNAVYAQPLPGDEPLPEDYYRAKRGHSTFLFRIPLPLSFPASINFANGLARVRYEVRGSVGVFWKGERQLVTDKDEVGVLESYEEDLFGFGVGSRAKAEEGVVVVGENGRFWMHGRIIGGLLVAGESSCVELQVKNHSNRKNTGLILALNRTLVLPSTNQNPIRISDTILTVPYKGSEYILPPGGEGVAHLVFDVPLSARSVKGGTYEGDGDEDPLTSEALFSIQANVEVKVVMGLGSKDIVLDVPVTIVHPDALPDLPLPQPQPQVVPPPDAILYPQYTSAPHPNLNHHIEQQRVFQPSIDPQTQQVLIPSVPYQYYHSDNMYFSPDALSETVYPAQEPTYTYLNFAPRPLPPRPSSAGPLTTAPQHIQLGAHAPPISGLPVPPGEPHTVLLPLTNIQSYTPPRSQPPMTNHIPTESPQPRSFNETPPIIPGQREEGKGAIASRISRHLRHTSAVIGRGRSASPVAHRFGYTSAGGQNDVMGPPDSIAAETKIGPSAEGTMPIVGGTNGGGADPILHSPRPQIRHKQSFTNLNTNGQPVVKSDNVIELEKIAAGLNNLAGGHQGSSGEELERREEVKCEDKAAPSPGNDMNMNKTLPPPPLATKPRQHGQRADQPTGIATATDLLNSLFTPPPLDSPQLTAQEPSAPVPPTPTLVARKRPPRLPVPPVTSGGGETESGLDALERRLAAQVGTRKVEKTKKPDVRTVLAAGRTPPPGPDTKSRGIPKSVPSTSTTPNPEGKPVQSGNGSVSASVLDESAISSLTLDQSSGGDGEGGGDDRKGGGRLKNGEDDDQEQEQESVDGGKTHKAGKSIVGAESYFQSRNHPPQQQHRRERAAVEPRKQLRPSTADSKLTTPTGPTAVNSPSTSKKRPSTATATVVGPDNKSKKSAQTRGRITAWLGKIDPDAPPPQEEIIPPSPSVVKPVEWDLDEKWDDEGPLLLREEAKEERERVLGAFRTRRHTRSRTRSRSRSRSLSRGRLSPPSPPERQATTSIRDRAPSQAPPMPSSAAASPNPRSSGFMPMDTLKAQRDSVTKSMSKSMLRRGRVGKELTIVAEARRVMDIWSEGLVDTPAKKKSVNPVVVTPTPATKKKEEKKSQYPFMAPGPPRAQTIRTDRRVSPPSTTAGATVGSDTPMLEPSIPINEKSEGSRATPSPVSYANIASQASSNASAAGSREAGPEKKEPRFPAFLPPLRQDPEVKYDVRSARGGRGGKVTQVASLWASVATGTAGGPSSNAKMMERGANREKVINGRKDVKGPVAGKNGALVQSGAASNSPPAPPMSISVGAKKSAVPPLLLPVSARNDVKGETTTNTSAKVKSAAASSSSPTHSAPTSVEAKKLASPPLLLPRKSTTATGNPLAGSGANSVERARPQSKTPTPPSKPNPPPPASKPKIFKPASKSPTSTKSKSPPPVSFKPPLTSPASSDKLRSNKYEKTKGISPMQVPLAKAPSVPALISSSLATPTLSSTASLVRPVGRANGKTVTIAVGLPGIGKGDYKSAVVSGSGVNGPDPKVSRPESSAARKKSVPGTASEGIGSQAQAQGKSKSSPSLATTPISAAKSNGAVAPVETDVDLRRPARESTAFGQARLRDLIKKYQGGNA